MDGRFLLYMEQEMTFKYRTN